MKKVIITAIAVTTAAVAAQAQGVARDVNEFGKEYIQTQQAAQAVEKQNKEKINKLAAAAERQYIAHLRAEKRRAQEAAQAQADKKTAPKAADEKSNQTPYYYYGKEGKVLALSDQAAKAVQGDSAPAQPAQTQAPAKKTTENKSFWRYLLPGRLPNESWESYNARMSFAANQPFK